MLMTNISIALSCYHLYKMCLRFSDWMFPSVEMLRSNLLYDVPVRYGAVNMAAVKPMMHKQPEAAKPNSSHNNNNNSSGQTAAPNLQQQDHSIRRVCGQQCHSV